MILLDSNVLLYATGGEHALREPCRAILSAVGEGAIVGHVTDIVLVEFVYARARRAGRESASQLARDVIDTVASVVTVTDRARRRAIALYATSIRLSINDAYIAATSLEHGLDLVSADQDFVEVPGLTVLAPDSAEAVRLLSQT